MKKIALALTWIVLLLMYGIAQAEQATLIWTITATNATKTLLARRLSTDPPAKYTDIATVPSPENTYIDKALEAGKIYCWVVYSQSDTSTSLPSTENCLLATPNWKAILYIR